MSREYILEAGSPIISIFDFNDLFNAKYMCYLNDRDMKTYLIWKRDSNAEGRQSSIHLRQVEQDGITFRDEWKNVTLLRANYSTEKRVIEGPWMIYRYLNNFACIH